MQKNLNGGKKESAEKWKTANGRCVCVKCRQPSSSVICFFARQNLHAKRTLLWHRGKQPECQTMLYLVWMRSRRWWCRSPEQIERNEIAAQDFHGRNWITVDLLNRHTWMLYKCWIAPCLLSTDVEWVHWIAVHTGSVSKTRLW